MVCVNRLIINLSAFIYKLVIEYMGGIILEEK